MVGQQRGPGIAKRADAPMSFGHIEGVDKPLSRLILGTMMFSTRTLSYNCAMLDHFVALGGTTLDTAHVYGSGDCERAAGLMPRE